MLWKTFSNCKTSNPLLDTCESFFQTNMQRVTRVMLVEGERVLKKMMDCMEEFSKCIEKIANELDLYEFHSWPMEIVLMK